MSRHHSDTTSGYSARASRITDALHRKLGHHPDYYTTAYSFQDGKPLILVYVSKQDQHLIADIPQHAYGIPVKIESTTRTRPANADHPHLPSDDILSHHDFARIEQEILDGYTCWTALREARPHNFILTLPYWDSMGDPIFLAIDSVDDGFQISDAGLVGGHLFSLNQHEEGTPGYDLATTLADIHDITVDHEQGKLSITCSREDLYDTIANFTKVVIAILTVTQHLPNLPNR